MKKNIILFMIIFISSQLFSNDTNNTQDLSSYYKDKSEKIVQTLWNKVQNGEADAEDMRRLGVFFEHGIYVEKSCRIAASFYMSSIKNGGCKAYKNLREMIDKGNCLKKEKDYRAIYLSLEKAEKRCEKNE